MEEGGGGKKEGSKSGSWVARLVLRRGFRKTGKGVLYSLERRGGGGNGGLHNACHGRFPDRKGREVLVLRHRKKEEEKTLKKEGALLGKEGGASIFNQRGKERGNGKCSTLTTRTEEGKKNI